MSDVYVVRGEGPRWCRGYRPPVHCVGQCPQVSVPSPRWCRGYHPRSPGDSFPENRVQLYSPSEEGLLRFCPGDGVRPKPTTELSNSTSSDAGEGYRTPASRQCGSDLCGPGTTVVIPGLEWTRVTQTRRVLSRNFQHNCDMDLKGGEKRPCSNSLCKEKPSPTSKVSTGSFTGLSSLPTLLFPLEVTFTLGFLVVTNTTSVFRTDET